MLTFIESGAFVYVLAAVAAVGMITKLLSAVRYSRLEHHTEDVGLTQDTYIRLWKNKFENAYRINKGMNDPELFVERCINQCKLLGLSLGRWDRLNRILCSVCLALGAAAVTIEVRGGVETNLVLDHFLTSVSICSLMIFIEVFCETGGKRQRIGLNLTEYFVNTLSHRLKNNTEMVTAEPESFRRELRERGDAKTEKANSDELAKEMKLFSRDEDSYEAEREQILRESLERIAASREPQEPRREKRRQARREEDVRLIEEILREYLK